MQTDTTHLLHTKQRLHRTHVLPQFYCHREHICHSCYHHAAATCGQDTHRVRCEEGADMRKCTGSCLKQRANKIMSFRL